LFPYVLKICFELAFTRFAYLSRSRVESQYAVLFSLINCHGESFLKAQQSNYVEGWWSTESLFLVTCVAPHRDVKLFKDFLIEGQVQRLRRCGFSVKFETFERCLFKTIACLQGPVQM